jgi:O-antigen ligase
MGFSVTPLLIVALMLLAATGLDWNADLAWYDQNRIEQIGLLSTTALSGLTIWRHDVAQSITNLPCRVRWAFAWAFWLGLLSAVIAVYPRFAILEWATLLLLLGLVLLLGEQSRRDVSRFDIWAIRLVVSLAVVITLKLLAGYLAALIAVGRLDTIMLFEGAFSNRRFFGQVASMAVPLLAYPLLKSDASRLPRWGLYALLSVWWMLIIVSGTRGTWVALFAASVVLALVAWRTCYQWLRIQLLTAMAGALLFGVMFVWVPSWLGQGASVENRLSNLATLSGRHELWRLAWMQIAAHPWLGIGPMHLATIRNEFGAHPHNALLQLAAEWGIPATLGLVLPAVAGLIVLLADLRRPAVSHNFLLVCLTASLLTAGVQSMVDGVIVIPYTQVWLVLIVGWALGVHFRDKVKVVAASRLICLVVPTLTLGALVALLNGVYPEILNRTEATKAFVDAGNSLVPPRYWAVGWIP